uniref:C2H2-type domain-containing protein n=1 Tax=Strombidium inclinatum TaxID=197538 RepID=A0A7S3IF54_9SPIT|mmetsp:Transcript_13633/g.21343  ORF Transcript_13633/g.21343 Transcript_13633/m.21343 type:complete len:194 (+) Transcript_13633:765-1346(+)|eukprot:CAMPEP_0170495022 /NCGR_PEP_ID=MMETSP0208-20121228/14973_1 /TAXON_ID=197538 /ORGANISM="Strombidium inclinatum, Strain S3" /LENGTH=193 /DNA_ID=CAMNT_0010771157 /DNA_START=765 /DNA_END=1346 /DNA_ORIENTATION=+
MNLTFAQKFEAEPLAAKSVQTKSRCSDLTEKQCNIVKVNTRSSIIYKEAPRADAPKRSSKAVATRPTVPGRKKRGHFKKIRLPKTFKCNICHAQFPVHQQLGGHISKAHPNQSKIFKKKHDVRTKREPQRAMLQVVKILVDLEVSQGIHDLTGDRLKSRYYKIKRDAVKRNDKNGLYKFDTSYLKNEISLLHQ